MTETTIDAILQRHADRLGISIEQLIATGQNESLNADLAADLRHDREIDQMIKDQKP